MPLFYGDAIAELVSAPGTSAFNLGVAATACRLFAAGTRADGTAVATGDTCFYAAFAVDANGNPSGAREIGLGTFTSGAPNTLARSTILESSNSNLAVNFTGSTRVELVALSRDQISPVFPVFSGSALPAIPSEGARLFARSRASQSRIAMLTSRGIVRELGFNGASVVRQAISAPNSTAPNSAGLSLTAIGTNTNKLISNADSFSRWTRAANVSSAAAGSFGGWRLSGTWFRSPPANDGGMIFLCTFGVGVLPASGRVFCGLYSASSVIPNVDPSTLTNTVGVCADAADSNLKIFCNSASLGTPIDLGAGFPKAAGSGIFELRLFFPPADANIYWSVENRLTNELVEGVFTSNLPLTSIALAPQLWINNETVAGAVEICMGVMSVESLL